MKEGPVDYASVNNPITSGSPVVAGRKERTPTAVNRLDYVAYELLIKLFHKAILLALRFDCCYSVALIRDVIDWSSSMTETLLF